MTTQKPSDRLLRQLANSVRQSHSKILLAELYAQVLQQEPSLQEYLISRYKLTPTEADDITQDTISQFYLKTERYSDIPNNPYAWIVRVATNKAVSTIRSKVSSQRFKARLTVEIAAGNYTPITHALQIPDDQLISSELSALVSEVILYEVLPKIKNKKQQEAVRLYLIDELNRADIANCLRIPIKQVRDYVAKGLARCRENKTLQKVLLGETL